MAVPPCCCFCWRVWQSRGRELAKRKQAACARVLRCLLYVDSCRVACARSLNSLLKTRAQFMTRTSSKAHVASSCYYGCGASPLANVMHVCIHITHGSIGMYRMGDYARMSKLVIRSRGEHASFIDFGRRIKPLPA
eukprot:6191755-Pleurochrysis_carterae.AAC.1